MKLPPFPFNKGDKATPLHRRGWDRYLICGPEYALELCVSVLGVHTLCTVALTDLKSHKTYTSSYSQLSVLRDILPPTELSGNVHCVTGKYGVHFLREGKKHVLIVHTTQFAGNGTLTANLTLTEAHSEHAMYSCGTPGKGHYCSTRRIPAFRAEGYVSFGGETVEFGSDSATASLDWVRGSWKNAVNYVSLRGFHSAENGEELSFFLSEDRYAFAPEDSVLFLGNERQNIGRVSITIPEEDERSHRFCGLWTVENDRKTLSLSFTPDHCRKSSAETRQIFGRLNGTLVDREGETIQIKDFPAIAEKTDIL